MLLIIKKILIILLFISILGYIFVVLRQKLYLYNNVIVIRKNLITSDLLKRVNLKEFSYNGEYMKSGDEVKILSKNNINIKGILIGIGEKDQIIYIISYKNKLKKIALSNIISIKLISRYGYFFKNDNLL